MRPFWNTMSFIYAGKGHRGELLCRGQTTWPTSTNQSFWRKEQHTHLTCLHLYNRKQRTHTKNAHLAGRSSTLMISHKFECHWWKAWNLGGVLLAIPHCGDCKAVCYLFYRCFPLFHRHVGVDTSSLQTGRQARQLKKQTSQMLSTASLLKE